MARNFGGTSADKIFIGDKSVLHPASAVSCHYWANHLGTSIGDWSMIDCRSSVASNSHGYILQTTVNSSKGRALIYDTAFRIATSAAAVPTSGFYTATHTWSASTGNLKHWLNNVAATTGSLTTNIAYSNSTNTLGYRDSSSDSEFMVGDLAECVIWNVELQINSVGALSRGVSPFVIEHESIVG